MRNDNLKTYMLSIFPGNTGVSHTNSQMHLALDHVVTEKDKNQLRKKGLVICESDSPINVIQIDGSEADIAQTLKI